METGNFLSILSDKLYIKTEMRTHKLTQASTLWDKLRKSGS